MHWRGEEASQNRENQFLHKIVTCDEKVVSFDNRRRTAQRLNADATPEDMSNSSLNTKNGMMTVYNTNHPLFFFTAR